MRGEVLGFDAGVGVIAGVDGSRYQFSSADLTGATASPGQTVDFDAGPDGQARNVTVAPSRSGTGRFDLGQVIERTFKSIAKNWAVYFGASALLIGVPSLIMTWGQTNLTLATQGMSSWGPVIGALVVGFALLLMGGVLLQAIVLKAAVNGFNGKSTTFGNAFETGLKKALPLVGLAIVMGMALVIGFILLIVPGIVLAVFWAVAAPVLVAENRGVFASLERSADLTKGHRWALFGLLVIYAVLSWIIGIVVAVVGGALGALATGAMSGPVMMVINAIINVLSGVVGSAGAASLYFELRSAKEGAIAEDLLAVFD